jgi:beta-glucosidase
VKPFSLGPDFLLGTATAALQIEGGDHNNNWYRWSEMKRIKDGSHSLRANDHYNRIEQDIALMQEMNNHTYRMGLEWSRIEPARGEWSEEGLAHYRRELTLLRRAGITPLVTLHHFSHPLWFEDLGGWESDESPELFRLFTIRVVEYLGDLVHDWITINEPNVYALGCYMSGDWPPGKKSIPSYLRVLRNMIAGHILAYKEIHRVRSEHSFPGKTMVGVANHIRVFDPEDNEGARRAARWMDHMFHQLAIIGMVEGRLVFPLGLIPGKASSSVRSGFYMDFFGLNYYSRDIVGHKPWSISTMFGEQKTDPGLPKNDLGWDIYPEGIYRICQDYYSRYKVPIFITENGICDSDDDQRPGYIISHLAQVARLIAEGIPVERYYHWTLMDNFEWIEGESARFGLIHCDFESQERTIRRSGRLYGEICSARAVTQEMIDQYL